MVDEGCMHGPVIDRSFPLLKLPPNPPHRPRPNKVVCAAGTLVPRDSAARHWLLACARACLALAIAILLTAFARPPVDRMDRGSRI